MVLKLLHLSIIALSFFRAFGFKRSVTTSLRPGVKLMSMMSSPPPKKSKFDRAVDDFVSKRYGQGEAWYGKRTSDLSDEDYDKLYSSQNPKIEEEEKPLKENAILIVGSLESFGQFVSFELATKGFNIRIVSPDKKKAVCGNTDVLFTILLPIFIV